MSNKAKTKVAAEILYALGNPIRLTIIQGLAVAEVFGGRSITELANGTGLSRQAITKHLDALEKAGLVKRNDLGRATLYELRVESLLSTLKWLSSIPKDWERTQKKLKSFLNKFQREL